VKPGSWLRSVFCNHPLPHEALILIYVPTMARASIRSVFTPHPTPSHMLSKLSTARSLPLTSLPPTPPLTAPSISQASSIGTTPKHYPHLPLTSLQTGYGGPLIPTSRTDQSLSTTNPIRTQMKASKRWIRAMRSYGRRSSSRSRGGSRVIWRRSDEVEGLGLRG